jgi:hypothetical protein
LPFASAKRKRPELSPGRSVDLFFIYLRKREINPVKNDPMPSNPSKGRMEAVCGSPLALPWPWLAAFALEPEAAFWSAVAELDGAVVADWSAALLPVVVLVALGVAAAAPLCALWSVVLVELDEAELLSLWTVLEELGVAELLPAWLLELSVGVVLVELGLVLVEDELELAPGAVAAFWSVVLEGAAVGFAWPEVWSVAPGVVEVCPEVALGVVFDGVAVLWLELDGALDWFMSELLLLDGVVVVVVVVVVDGWLLLAAGVWLLLLFGSVLVLDVWPIAIPADSSNAEHV